MVEYSYFAFPGLFSITVYQWALLLVLPIAPYF